MEARGEIPEGTSSRWAHHTKSLKSLPEKKKKKKAADLPFGLGPIPDPADYRLSPHIPGATAGALGITPMILGLLRGLDAEPGMGVQRAIHGGLTGLGAAGGGQIGLEAARRLGGSPEAQLAAVLGGAGLGGLGSHWLFRPEEDVRRRRAEAEAAKFSAAKQADDELAMPDRLVDDLIRSRLSHWYAPQADAAVVGPAGFAGMEAQSYADFLEKNRNTPGGPRGALVAKATEADLEYPELLAAGAAAGPAGVAAERARVNEGHYRDLWGIPSSLPPPPVERAPPPRPTPTAPVGGDAGAGGETGGSPLADFAGKYWPYALGGAGALGLGALGYHLLRKPKRKIKEAPDKQAFFKAFVDSCRRDGLAPAAVLRRAQAVKEAALSVKTAQGSTVASVGAGAANAMTNLLTNLGLYGSVLLPAGVGLGGGLLLGHLKNVSERADIESLRRVALAKAMRRRADELGLQRDITAMQGQGESRFIPLS